MSKEILSPDSEKTWKKILNFTVELIKLIIAAFLGGTTANII